MYYANPSRYESMKYNRREEGLKLPQFLWGYGIISVIPKVCPT